MKKSRRKVRNIPPLQPVVTPKQKSKSIRKSKSNSKSTASSRTTTSATSTSSSSSSSSAGAKKSKKEPEIISLVEMEENHIQEALKRSIRDAFSPRDKKKQKTSPEIIILSDSDDDNVNNDDGGGKMSRSSSTATIDLLDPKSTANDEDDDDDDDIMIVDAAEAQAQNSFQSSSAKAGGGNNGGDGEDDDEIMEMGTKGGMDLVHMRQHCTRHQFVQDAMKKPTSEQEAATAKNKHYCDKCYCYICDVPAKDCKHWDVHCNASDKGLDAGLWKRMREKAKRGEITSTYPSTGTASTGNSRSGEDLFRDTFFQFLMDSRRGFFDDESDEYHSAEEDFLDDYERGLHVNRTFHVNRNNPFRQYGEEFCGLGPFEPDKVQVGTPLSARLTQCRRCKWWNKRPASEPTFQSGTYDWCHACGRVMSEHDFDKERSRTSPHAPVTGEISLGERIIPFRIKARDPRKIKPYDAKWKELEGQEGWIYDEKEMKEDFFRHRITKKPSLDRLLANLSILEEDKIPDKGSVHDYRTTVYRPESSSEKKEYSALETEALIIDDRNHRFILQHLSCLKNAFFNSSKHNLEIKWDAESGSGTITIALYLTEHAFSAGGSGKHSFAHLLGAWYDMFPLKLSELTNGLPCAANPRRSVTKILRSSTGLRPFELDKDSRTRLAKCFDDDNDKEALDRYKAEANDISSKFSFLASSGKAHNGGVCSNDNTFKATMTRFFKESFVDSFRHNDLESESFCHTPAARELGIISCHRIMLGPRDREYNQRISETYSTGVNGILDPEEVYILDQYLRPQLERRVSDVGTINGLLMQLENLHHEQVDHVEGLNVELFDFQREAVQWALEREKMDGGIQSTLWTKIPGDVRKFVSNTKTRPVDLYYSPALDMFREGKPKEVRGGIIAEQMGLGKTVISLALILTNPAPVTPLTASLVKDYTRPTTPTTAVSLWPENPIDESSPVNRAKYFCQGTLVVCNVSLVGQWIDEAKSKLKDPGLVYSYHGGSRKRCPKILAKNAIVVTTYATLASDSNYWRNKSNDSNYCPPCEQIWWWRIICDESHALKDQSTHHFRALNSIQAVNKWCVTGTPMNTSVKDLRGQFAFIGLENVSSYFSAFAAKMPSHFHQSTRRRSYSSSNDRAGQFLFMMRSIMMRHAIQMKSRAEERSIMSLPPKEEKVLKITFSKKERDEYSKLESDAREVYEAIKSQGRAEISKNYLKISSALLPLRVACSGGQADEGENSKNNTEEEKPAANPDEPKKKKKKKVIEDLIFKSKFERLVVELKRIRDTEPQSKSLVFSQFFSTLQWMKQELPKHGFQFRTLSGDMPMTKRAKALRDFQQDPPTTIFLLSMRSGAVGINLTQANRVFLMEPAMNPALEAQAVGRVYRLGQRKAVQVIRMCIKDTVESRLMALLAKKYGKASKPEPKKSKDKDGEEKKDDDNAAAGEDSADPNTASVSAMHGVGHMNQDKGALLANEFDLLFNVA